MKAIIVNDIRSQLGEGPTWYGATATLYWVDIEGRQIHAMSGFGNVRAFATPQEIGCFIPLSADHGLAAMESGIYMADLQAGTFDFLCHPAKGTSYGRYNDGKMSPDGIFYVGTMAGEPGQNKLYAVRLDGSWSVVCEGITCSNGLAWDMMRRRMYYIDSPTQCVIAFQYGQNGPFGGTTCIQIDPAEGMPDGMAIDRDGMLWIAHWGGGMICQYNPDTGCRLRQVDLPAKYVTSAAFGSICLDDLYITTARQDDLSEAAGALFCIRNV